MSAEFRFVGHERVTIELDGWCAADAVRIPQRLALDLDGGRARVGLFAFHVDPLRIVGVPFARWSYPEVLWRVAVRDGDRPAWWVAACDLEPLGPRLAASRLVRYPVRHVPVTVDDARIATGWPNSYVGQLVVGIDAPGAPVDPGVDAIQRPLLVGPDARHRVPWGDDGLGARSARVTIEADSLAAATVGGPVEWAAVARVRHGRQHRCGVAQVCF